MNVAIVETGIANTASVLAGLRRAGADPELTEDASTVRDADALVLPGVGAFAPGMQRLRAEELVEPLRARLREGRPTLAVCLGLQLLCRSSDESAIQPAAPGGAAGAEEVEGLGIIDAHVTRFPDSVRVPQLGWNRVEPSAECTLLKPGYAYFANSYRLEHAPSDWHCARTEHGGSFVAAAERGAQLACQFHPELSGRWGIELLRRWLERAATSLGGQTSC